MARPSIFDYDDLRDKPRKTTAELEEMIVYIIRSPDVCEFTRRYMHPDDWNEDDEKRYKLLVGAFFTLYESKRHPIGEIPYEAVAAKFRLFADKDDRLKKSPESIAEIDELLHRAYETVDASRLDVRRGIAIVKEFIERRVDDPSRRELDQAADAIGMQDGDGTLSLYTSSLLAKFEKRRAKIEALRTRLRATLKDCKREDAAFHAAGLDRELIGLKTGLASLDRRLDGAQGVIVVVAGPGRGKTVLLSQIGCGVADDFDFNDACVVVLSLEMKTKMLRFRIRSHLARMDWSVLRHGSPEVRRERRRQADPPRGQPRAHYYTQEDNAKLDEVEAKLNGDFGDRITVYGKDDLPDVIDADVLVSLLAEAKARAGATRGLLAIDFLQFMQAPEAIESELDRDNWRIQTLKDVAARTASADNPEGDVVLVASEASKPANAKDDWAVELRDVKGSGRTVSLADTCLHIRKLSNREVQKTYGLASADKDVVDKRLAKLDKRGVWPAMFVLTKSRDGTRRSAWPMELQHRRSTWRPPPKPPVIQRNGADRDVDRNGDDKLEAARDRLLKVMEAFPRGETETVLAKAAGIGKKQIKAILKQLIADGLVEMVTIVKPHGAGERRHKGYRLVAANGQPAGSPSNNGSTSNGRH